MIRHRALVARDRAEKNKNLRRAASAEFSRHVSLHSEAIDDEVDTAMSRIARASSRQYNRHQYFSSPFATHNVDTLEEIGPLRGNEQPLTSLMPATKFCSDTPEKIEDFMARRVEGDLAVDIDLEEMLERGRAAKKAAQEAEERKKEQEKQEKKEARRKKRALREASSRRRSSIGGFTMNGSICTGDNTAVLLPHIPGSGDSFAALYGKKGRTKFFEDLQRQYETLFDHQLDHDPAKLRKEMERKQKRMQKKKRDLYERRTYEIEDEVINSKIEHKNYEAPVSIAPHKSNKKKPHKDGDGFFGKVTYETTDSSLNESYKLDEDPSINHLYLSKSNGVPTDYKKERRQKFTLTRSPRNLAKLRLDADKDCSKHSLVGRNETVHLSDYERQLLAYEASQSLQDVLRRNRDPRIKYVRDCSSKGLLPEPLLVGKQGEAQSQRILDLSHYKIGNRRMLSLIPSLKDICLHRKLIIRDNRLDDTVLSQFIDAFSKDESTNTEDNLDASSHMAFVSELNISENRIGPRTIESFGQFCRLHASTFVKLDLSSTDLSDRDAHTLFDKHLELCISLTSLRLSHNKIQSNATCLLAGKLLAKNKLPKLETLDVSWNNITHRGVHALADSLHHNNTIRKLNLDYNTAGSAAQYFAAPLLTTNKTLTDLSLVANSIDGKAAIVLAEMLIESSSLTLTSLNLNDNPITKVGAQAFILVLARGVAMKCLQFRSEYSDDDELEKLLDPHHLSLDSDSMVAAEINEENEHRDMLHSANHVSPKLRLVSLDVGDPFQRAQATMLLRSAAESSGFSMRSVKYFEDVSVPSSPAHGGEEIELVRKCIDLEAASIKTYKKHFMDLCREKNPELHVGRINDAFLSASQARDLLRRVHGMEACDLMIRLIISAFDANDDGIIEWGEFEMGIDHAKSLFGPSVRRTGQNPIGTMCRVSESREYMVPMEGRLVLSFCVTPVPKLPHHECTRANFRKIIKTVVEPTPPRVRLILIQLLVSQVSLSLDQATRLCKIIEAHPGADIEGSGFVLDNITEVVLALTHKSDGAILLSRLFSTTRIALRNHMRSNYRALVGIYTGRFHIDLGRHQDRLVATQLLSYYNLRTLNSLRRRNGMLHGRGAERERNNGNGNADTSVCQDGLPFHNVQLDSKPFNMRPYVFMPDQADDTPVLPLPSHGILLFDSFEFYGPDPRLKPLSETEFKSFIENLHLGSIAGVLPTHVIGQNLSENTDQSSSGEKVNPEVVSRPDPNKPTPSRFAQPSEIMMATRIESVVRARLAMKKIKSMRRAKEIKDFFSNLINSKQQNHDDGGESVKSESVALESAAISVQRFFRERQKRIRAQERREGRLLAPTPGFPASTKEIPILSKRERRRKFLWPLVPSMRRHKANHAAFWKWCDSKNHNARVCTYNDMSSRKAAVWNRFFYLNREGRKHLSNKINFILERVSTICLTSRQLRLLISKLPSRVIGCRCEVAVSCFNRLVDPKLFEVEVMSLLSSRERDICMKRLGALNVIDARYVDRQYVLDLSVPSERFILDMLLQLAIKEGGGRHFFYQSFFQETPEDETPKDKSNGNKVDKKNKTKNKKGKKGKKGKKPNEDEHSESDLDEDEDEDLEGAFSFETDPRFSTVLPTNGVFSFRYGVPDGANELARKELVKKCTYAGRVETDQDKYIEEIISATKIGAIMRGSLARMRYARTKHVILQVEFARKQDRMSAVKIQSCLRGYWLRKKLLRAKAERKRMIQKEREERAQALEARQLRQTQQLGLMGYSPGSRREYSKKKRRSVVGLPLNFNGIWGNSKGGNTMLNKHFSTKEKRRRNSLFATQAISGGGLVHV